MKLPADAGAVLVDLGSHLRLRQLVVPAAILLVVGLLPAGDPTLWPISAFVGGILVVTVVLTTLVRRGVRRVIAVCERGLVIRRGTAVTSVPWARVRRMHARWRALRGSRVQEIVVDTDGGPARFGFDPGHAPSREQDQRTARAVAAIEQHAHLELTR